MQGLFILSKDERQRIVGGIENIHKAKQRLDDYMRRENIKDAVFNNELSIIQDYLRSITYDLHNIT